MPTPTNPTAFDWNLVWFSHRDCLPHLRQSNALYFITFRLADSLPKSRLDTLRKRRDRWLLTNPPPHNQEQAAQLHRLWTAPIERLLDAGHGTCLLRDPTCRHFLESTLHHDDAKTYRLGDFVIMPNHVHLLLHVLSDNNLSNILQAWKSISARNINRHLHRSGTLWQPEPFDHIVRNTAHWQKFIRYIQKNPSRLPPNTFTLSRGTLASPS